MRSAFASQLRHRAYWAGLRLSHARKCLSNQVAKREFFQSTSAIHCYCEFGRRKDTFKAAQLTKSFWSAFSLQNHRRIVCILPDQMASFRFCQLRVRVESKDSVAWRFQEFIKDYCPLVHKPEPRCRCSSSKSKSGSKSRPYRWHATIGRSATP